MPTKSVAQILAQLYDLLEPFSSEERVRITEATLVLLGEKHLANNDQQMVKKSDDKDSSFDNPNEFLENKSPKTKVEQLAVVARYREINEESISSTREDFEKFFNVCRINFEGNKLSDDLRHAKEAGLFKSDGSMANGFTLTAYGQKYVDALPDRDAIKKLIPSKPNKPKKPKKQPNKEN